MRKNKKTLTFLLSLILSFAFVTTSNAKEIQNDNTFVQVTAEENEISSPKANTEVSVHSGSLAPGQSVTYSFSLNWWRTIKISACGGNVNDNYGGGRIRFLASYYDFNPTSGIIGTVSLNPGDYSYTVINTSADTITYAVIFYY